MTSSGHGDDADDDGLKSLRAVWLSMPDEDPPDRGFAELMAAARVKAEQMTTPPLWERITQLLRRPPVLALASVMVLIGGAVLISQRGNDMEAQPPAARDEVSVGVQAPAPETATPQMAPAGSAVMQVGGARAQDNVSGAPADPAMSPEPARHQPAERVVTRPAPKSAPKRSMPPATTKSDRSNGFGAVSGGGAPGGEREATTSLLADDDAPTKKSAAKQEPTAKATVEASPSLDATAAPETNQAGPTVAQLHTQARAAAARGACASARTMMLRIAKQDAGYYKAKVVQDPALAACLPK